MSIFLGCLSIYVFFLGLVDFGHQVATLCRWIKERTLP